jgi:PAS domain S-box-containing protein
MEGSEAIKNQVRSILLVEDEAIIAMVESKLLERNGYAVSAVMSGEKAIEVVKEDNFDLILMDIDLGPGKMTGTKAAEIILEDHDIPIVFLSSHTEQAIVEKTEGITSYGYIVKNSGDTVLLASIKMAFRLFEAKKYEKRKLELDWRRQEVIVRLHEEMHRSEDNLYNFVLDASLEVTKSEYAFLGLLDEDESVMKIHAWSAGTMNDCSIIDNPMHFGILEAGIWGDCVRLRRPVIYNDYSEDISTKHGFPKGHVNIERFMGFPVFDGQKIVAVGAVANKREPYEFLDAESLISIYERMWNLVKRNQYEKEKRILLKRLQAAETASNFGSWIWNVETQDVWWSEGLYTIYGRDPDKKPIPKEDPNWVEKLIFAEDRESLRGAIRNSINNKEKFDVQYRIIREDTQQIRWLHAVGGMEPDEMGNRVVFIGSVQDITERKYIQDELKKSEANYRAIFHAFSYGVIFQDLDTGEVLDVNAKALEMYGYTDKEEMIGSLLDAFSSGIGKYTYEKALVYIHEAAEGIPQNFEWHAKRKNGDYFWVEVDLTSVVLFGQPRLIAVVREISKGKTE